MNKLDHFKLLYDSQLIQEAEWLRRTASGKVDSVEYLLKKNGIKSHSILELGCGTGAVLAECQRRGLAKTYTGIDYSKTAIEYLRSNHQGIDTMVADLTHDSFALDGVFDVVILSHVLEHLKEPGDFLLSVGDKINFSYIIIEVPLEDLFFSKLKAIIRDRTKNRAGHLQWFTEGIITNLILSCHFDIISKRRYVPIHDIDTVRMDCKRNHFSKATCVMKELTQHHLPKSFKLLWSLLYYSHIACLCSTKLI